MSKPGWWPWPQTISWPDFGIDIDAIGKALRDRGILFCVDGIQTVGAFPTEVKNVDFSGG